MHLINIPKYLSLIIVLSFACHGTAYAQNVDAKKELSADEEARLRARLSEIQVLDVNRDGKLQVGELLDSIKEKFAAADENHDGVISIGETENVLNAYQSSNTAAFGKNVKARTESLGNRYKSADANNDGKITEAEFYDYFGRRHEALDLNGDGIISVEEYRMDSEKMRPSYFVNKSQRDAKALKTR